jgi:hypothetical protein
MDTDFKSQVQKVQLDYKQNKDKVIDFLIDNIFTVETELPKVIKEGLLDEEINTDK